MAKAPLTIVNAKIAELTPHPRNPRKGNVEVIADSLAQHEQYSPLVVQKSTGHVLVGNHRLMAAEALGWDEIQVVYIDVDDEKATKILLADNRTSDLGAYDNEELVALLEELPDLAGTGYSNDDLDIMAADLELPDIIPASRQSTGEGGKRIVADTIEWGFLGIAKVARLTITRAEVEGLDNVLEQFKKDNGTESGFAFALIEGIRALKGYPTPGTDDAGDELADGFDENEGASA